MSKEPSDSASELQASTNTKLARIDRSYSHTILPDNEPDVQWTLDYSRTPIQGLCDTITTSLPCIEYSAGIVVYFGKKCKAKQQWKLYSNKLQFVYKIPVRWKEKEKGLAISVSLYELCIVRSILNFAYKNNKLGNCLTEKKSTQVRSLKKQPVDGFY